MHHQRYIGKPAHRCRRCGGEYHWVNRAGGILCVTCSQPPDGEPAPAALIVPAGGVWAADEFATPAAIIQSILADGLVEIVAQAARADAVEQAAASVIILDGSIPLDDGRTLWRLFERDAGRAAQLRPTPTEPIDTAGMRAVRLTRPVEYNTGESFPAGHPVYLPHDWRAIPQIRDWAAWIERTLRNDPRRESPVVAILGGRWRIMASAWLASVTPADPA